MTGRHFSSTYTRLVMQHVQALAGDAGVADLLDRSGQADRVAELNDETEWSSYDQFRRLLESALHVLGPADQFAALGTSGPFGSGSMPGATEALLTMGTPGAVLKELNANTAGTSTIEESFTEQEGPSAWRLGHRMHAGFEPYEALCAFHVASSALLPRLFGCTNVQAEEITCTRRGDAWCTISLSWDEDDGDAQRADFLANKLAIVERRLEVFEETVAKVVATDDLDSALRRIVAAAAGSVRAPAFVLALDPLPWAEKLVYGFGLPDEQAERVASASATDADVTVTIASRRGRHGRIIAVGARGLIPPSMETLLRGYAQLAATALDGALAVEESRRQTATAKVLLDLAMQLARTGSMDELGRTLVEVVPDLIGCDRAMVATVTELEATPVALHGYAPDMAAWIMAGPIPLRQPLPLTIVYAAQADVHGRALELMRAAGSLATVMVPMLVDGEIVAWISGDVTRDPSRLAPSAELEERLRGLAALASTAMHNTLLLDRVSHQADHDLLTDLPNRKGLVDRLAGDAVPTTAVLFVDLDDFKDVNDGLGHLMGDLLLCQVADRLRGAVRVDDLVARVGGDEFAVLVADPMPHAALELGRRVVEAFREPFDLRGQRVTVSASVGLTTQPGTPDELLRSADIAMYRAKAAGKGRLALFESNMDHAASERLELHADLTDAVARGQLLLHYQPVLVLADGSLRCGEALVRWQHPTLGLLPPDRFIPLAEDTGLIGAIGLWVLQEACQQAVDWPEEVGIAVNLSARQLDDPGIVKEVADVLARVGLRPERLVLEITESVMACDIDVVITRISQLRALGVRIAIDDFGTGFSSLSALVQLPVDILKIDRCLIAQMLDQPAAVGLVQILIDLGRTLGLEVVAEGIEELAQATALRERHCQLGQGFLYSRPVSAEAFARFFVAPVAPVGV